MDSNKTISSSFTITVKRIGENLFVVSVPVFGVRDAWIALKIAYKKVQDVGEENIDKIRATSVNPLNRKNFLCNFEFKSELDLNELKHKFKWGTYKIGE